MPRTQSWEDSLVSDFQNGNNRVMVIEPGDCTKYELLFVKLDNETCMYMHLPVGSYLVCNSNLSGMFTCMPFFKGQYLSWKHIKKHLHISAPGSCWMISEILSHFYDTQCQTWEEFEASVK